MRSKTTFSTRWASLVSAIGGRFFVPGYQIGSESMPRRYFAAVKPPSTVRNWPVM